MPLSRGSTPLRPLILGLNGNCTDSEKRDTTDENHHPHHGQPHLKLLAIRPFFCRGKLTPVDPGLPSYSTRRSRSEFAVPYSDRFLHEIFARDLAQLDLVGGSDKRGETFSETSPTSSSQTTHPRQLKDPHPHFMASTAGQ